MSQIMLKVDHAHTQYRERKFYCLSPIHWNSHERTMTKIKAQQRQIQKQLHLFLKRCENNVNWRELCFAFACSTTQTMLMNYTVNWNIILSVRDWGNLDVGLSDNERQLEVFGRVEKLAYENNNYRFYSIYWQTLWKKPFIFNCEPW